MSAQIDHRLLTAQELEQLLPALGYRAPSAPLLRQWRGRRRLTDHGQVQRLHRGRRESLNVYDVSEVMAILRHAERRRRESAA